MERGGTVGELTLSTGTVTADSALNVTTSATVNGGNLTLGRGGEIESLAMSAEGTVTTDGALTLNDLSGAGTINGGGKVTLTDADGTFSGTIENDLTYTGGAGNGYTLSKGFGGENLTVTAGTLTIGTEGPLDMSATSLKVSGDSKLVLGSKDTTTVTVGAIGTNLTAGTISLVGTTNIVDGAVSLSAGTKLEFATNANTNQIEGSVAMSSGELAWQGALTVDGIKGSGTLNGKDLTIDGNGGSFSDSMSSVRSMSLFEAAAR